MLTATIALGGTAMLLQAAVAAIAWQRYRGAGPLGWAWLCLLGACLLAGLRSAIPFWVALHVGLYDFRDALLATLSGLFLLAAVVGLGRR